MTSKLVKVDFSVDKDLVEYLENLLVRAKAGHIKNIVLCGENISTKDYFCYTSFTDFMVVLASIEYCRAAMFDRIRPPNL